MEKIIEIALNQLRAFKEFQDKEREGGMTVRDFDTWVGGFVSGASHALYGVVNSAEDMDRELRKLSEALVKSDVAVELGVAGTEKETYEIISENLHKDAE